MSDFFSQSGDAGEPLRKSSDQASESDSADTRPTPGDGPSPITPSSRATAPLGELGPEIPDGTQWRSSLETTRQSTRLSRDERSRRRHVRIEIAAVAVLVAAAVGALVGYEISSTSPISGIPTTFPTSTIPATSRNSSAPGAPSNAAALAATTDPALVDINFIDSYQAVEGAGTGMVLSSNGEVLTNNHVIEGATTISVVDVGNHKTYGAIVVGYDASQDIAVLRLKGASKLRSVTLGDSSTAKVGDGVVVVGNAEGAGGTPSYAGGSVTALGQSITAQDEVSGATEQLTGMIETNANVLPGDSGGALIDRAGQVIGMTSAASESYQFQSSTSQGYAISINQALTIARKIETGQASSTVHVGPTAFLGVLVETPFFGYSGAEIVEVVPSSAAAHAGLTPGDVITSVDGRAVTSPKSLTDLLLSDAPGTSVQLEYLDLSGQHHSATVTLGTGPAQ